MNTVKAGTHRTCTHTVCNRRPTEHCKPGCNALRREPTGVATILATCFETVKPNKSQIKTIRPCCDSV